MIAVLVTIVQHQRHGRIIHDIDTFHNACGHSSLFYLSGHETFVLRIGDLHERVLLNAFLAAIGTANNDSKLIDRCRSAAKPLAYGRTQRNAPDITARRCHFAFGYVLVPFGRNKKPRAFIYHADMYIHIARISVESRARSSLESNGQRLVGIGRFGTVTQSSGHHQHRSRLRNRNFPV